MPGWYYPSQKVGVKYGSLYVGIIIIVIYIAKLSKQKQKTSNQTNKHKEKNLA